MNFNPVEDKSRYALGLLMVLVTTTLWGILPVALKVTLNEISPGTIAWFRFTFSFVVLFAVLSLTGSKPSGILRRPPWLGILGGVCLAGNYYWMTKGVHFSGPSNAAILIQTASMLLIFVGVIFFREHLSRFQMLGLLVAVAGFYLFYSDQRGSAADTDLYSSANIYIVSAGVVWVIYMVCQKLLGVKFGAQLLNLLVYGIAGLALIPLVVWSEFSGLEWRSWMILLFLGVNTLLAYGALAEAVKYLPLALISVVVTLNPLITLAAMRVLPGISSGQLAPETIGTVGFVGAVTAVAGVVLVVSRKSTT